MKMLNFRGKLISRNSSKYLINWDKKSRSKPQFNTKQFLKMYWHHHIVYEEFLIPNSLLRIDILNTTLNIAIEVNGSQHGEYNPFFHNKSQANYLHQIKNDVQKANWLEINGYRLVIIFENEANYLSKEYFASKHNLIL